MKILIFLALLCSLAAPVQGEEIQNTDPLLTEDQFEIRLSEELKAFVQNYYYNFGPTRLHTTKSARFFLRNEGRFPLYIESIHTEGTGFWHQENCPRLLWPGERCTVRANFRPDYLGFYNGKLSIELFGSDDIQIFLRGRGVRGF